MKNVQHGKSLARKKHNMRKGATSNECKMKKEQHEKSATRKEGSSKKVQYEQTAT